MIKNNALRVNLRRIVDESYSILIGSNLFPEIAEDLKNLNLGPKYAIITDSRIKETYANSLETALSAKGIRSDIFAFESGEKNKSLETCMKIIGEMSKLKYGKDAVILALGGGVVSDVGGWISSNYLRGIMHIQIPTTLISQTDSAIGGRFTINTKYGKNFVGAIVQPKKIYVDIKMLNTLDEKDYRAGLAETVKHGIIEDAEFFSYIENNLDKILKRDQDKMLHIVNENCRIKTEIVQKDPEYKGDARKLNYGHTIGHALEKLCNYSIPHGEAVSIGMTVAGRISNLLGYFPKSELERQEKLLKAIGLPTKVPNEVNYDELIETTSRDKKVKGGLPRYVLPKAIGKMKKFDGEYADFVEDHLVIEALKETK